MTPPEFLAAVAEAFGSYAKSPEKPNGAEGSFIDGAPKPYAVMFSDKDEPYQFATGEEAIAKARQLRIAAEAQPDL